MELLNKSLSEIACALPGATRVFHEHRLDFCCAGSQSLAEASAKGNVDVAVVMQALESLKNEESDQEPLRHASPAQLIDHILRHFHEKHRKQLPELLRLARRVEAAHESRPDCPHGLADHIAFMEQDMESHMMKEEQILFPMLLRGLYGQSLPPILRMRHEHDQHGDSLRKLEELTHHFTPPHNACTTWRALYAGLIQLREDLIQHIHVENNLLFPMIEKDAGGVVKTCSACSACAQENTSPSQ